MNYLSACAVLIIFMFESAFGYLRVCYYSNWSRNKLGEGEFVPEKVDPNLCSHIIFAFAKLEGNRLAPIEWNDDSTDWSQGMHAKVNDLKKQNKNLKTLLAVGGWNAGSLPFSHMLQTDSGRPEFLNSTINFLRARNFDGLDLYWEYPANRGVRPEDRELFTSVLKELRTEFEQDAYRTGKPRLLLTAAVPLGKSFIASEYDVPTVAFLLDFLNLMTYDFHGAWEPVTGMNSPLYPRVGETGIDRMFNVLSFYDTVACTGMKLNGFIHHEGYYSSQDAVAKYWVELGAPKEKLIIGLPLYGRSFELQDPMDTNVGASAVGPGPAGKHTGERGFLAYYETCNELRKGALRTWHSEHSTPYFVRGNIWVGYDDVDSIREKVKWLKINGFGGAMIWSLALDDFSGNFCGQGPYPLLKTINIELGIKIGNITPAITLPDTIVPAEDINHSHVQPSVDLPPLLIPNAGRQSKSSDSPPALLGATHELLGTPDTMPPIPIPVALSSSEQRPDILPLANGVLEPDSMTLDNVHLSGSDLLLPDILTPPRGEAETPLLLSGPSVHSDLHRNGTGHTIIPLFDRKRNRGALPRPGVRVPRQSHTIVAEGSVPMNTSENLLPFSPQSILPPALLITDQRFPATSSNAFVQTRPNHRTPAAASRSVSATSNKHINSTESSEKRSTVITRSRTTIVKDNVRSSTQPNASSVSATDASQVISSQQSLVNGGRRGITPDAGQTSSVEGIVRIPRLITRVVPVESGASLANIPLNMPLSQIPLQTLATLNLLSRNFMNTDLPVHRRDLPVVSPTSRIVQPVTLAVATLPQVAVLSSIANPRRAVRNGQTAGVQATGLGVLGIQRAGLVQGVQVPVLTRADVAGQGVQPVRLMGVPARTILQGGAAGTAASRTNPAQMSVLPPRTAASTSGLGTSGVRVFTADPRRNNLVNVVRIRTAELAPRTWLTQNNAPFLPARFGTHQLQQQQQRPMVFLASSQTML